MPNGGHGNGYRFARQSSVPPDPADGYLWDRTPSPAHTSDSEGTYDVEKIRWTALARWVLKQWRSFVATRKATRAAAMSKKRSAEETFGKTHQYDKP